MTMGCCKDNCCTCCQNEAVQSIHQQSYDFGFRYVFKKDMKPAQRCVWVIIYTCLILILIYLLGISVLKYVEYKDVYITTSATYTAYNSSLPSLTICATGYSPAALDHNYPNLTSSPYEFVNHLSTYSFSKEGDTSPEFEQFIRNNTANEALYKLINITLRGCYIGGDEPMVCDGLMTPMFSHYADLICYTLASDQYVRDQGVINITYSGVYNGVSFVIDSDPIGNELIAKVHEPGINPDMTNDIFTMSPGSRIYVGLEKKKYQRLKTSYPEDGCLYDYEASELINSTLPNMNYSQQSCFNKCTEDQLYKACNCTVNTYGRRCSLYEYLNCKRSKKICNTWCLPKCSTVNYNVHVSRVPLVDVVSYVDIIVYFNTMEHSISKQLPVFGVEQVLSNIGGLVGLLIGVSLLSVLQCIEGCFINICTKRKGRDMSKNETTSEKSTKDIDVEVEVAKETDAQTEGMETKVNNNIYMMWTILTIL